MINNRFLCCAAHKPSRGGFTLVELLVVIGIIAILAGVALGPITKGIKQAQESTSMQTCRQVGLMEFAYSNDNSQVYPYASGTGASETIANLLLNGNYASDPTVFYIAATPGSVKPTPATAGVYNQTTKFCAYDFVINSSGSGAGLNSTAADGTPLCELTGASWAIPATVPAAGIFATLTTTKTAFTADGIAVCYKSNSAVFLRAATASTSTATTIQPIITGSYSDPSGVNYTLVTP